MNRIHNELGGVQCFDCCTELSDIFRLNRVDRFLSSPQIRQCFLQILFRFLFLNHDLILLFKAPLFDDFYFVSFLFSFLTLYIQLQ